MRLFEITRGNLVSIELFGFKIDFEKDMTFIEETHALLLKLKSPYRYSHFEGNIDNIEEDLRSFIDFDFEPDPDITSLKKRATEIYDRLQVIRSEAL